MAFRRTLSIRATLLPRTFNPSFTYISHLHHDHSNIQDLHSPGSIIDTYLAHIRTFKSCVNSDISWQFSGAFRLTGYGRVRNGLILNRYMSTSIGEADDKTSFLNEAPTVITGAPPMEGVSEVAIAAADSVFPVAALQYLIDSVHSFTGFNWWASIALATLLVRGALVPLLLSIHKENVKLAMIRPRLRQIKEQSRAAGMIAEGNKKIKELLKDNGVTPFTPYKGICIQLPIFISFILAISNMAEKVPSFKTGGALWFTDLSTPDAMYIFPVLTALSVLVPFELHLRRALKGDPTMINSARIFAVVLVPLTMSFPKGIFCYWLTSNMFVFCYGSVLKNPRVRKALGIPERPTAPPSTPSAG